MNCNNDCNQGRDCTCRPTDEQIEQWQAQDRADFIAAMVVLGLVAVAAVLLFAHMAGAL